MKKKIFRIAALSGSLEILLKGQLKFMNQYYEIVGVASFDPQSEKIVKNEGIRMISLHINRKINIAHDLVSLIKLYFLFRKEKPFIVHSITPKAGLLSMVAAYFARVPYRLHTFTGLVFPSRSGFMRKVLIFFDKLICFCATNVYPEGQGVKNDLKKYQITKKSLTIFGHGNVNGIDLTYFDPNVYSQSELVAIRAKIGLQQDDFVFLFIGRIVFDKGIKELITSFTEIQKNHSTVKLVLVGPYEKKIDPLPLKIENEITNNTSITRIGWQDDVRPYYALSNVFVFPSYREGFPNVLLQAGAMGKFSIVTNINGSNEIIKQEENGVIIPTMNSSALKKEMLKCLNMRSFFESPNFKYREMIAKKYDQSIVWNAILKEYETMK